MLPKVDKRFHANYLRFLDTIGVSYEEFGELFSEEVQSLPPAEQATMHGFNWLIPNTLTAAQGDVMLGVISRVVQKAKRRAERKRTKDLP